MATHRILNFSQMRQVELWLKKNMSRINQERPERIVIAEQASKDLGFLITFSNINYVANQTEIKLPNSRITGGRIDQVARHYLAQLYQKLNEPIPPELHDFLVADKIPGKEI